MHSTPGLIEKWTLIVNPQDFCSWFVGLELMTDVSRDAFDAPAGIIRRGGDCGRHERGRTVSRNRARHRGQSLVGPFHNIVATGAVDVHVDESWHGGFVGCFDFLRSSQGRKTPSR